MSRVKEITEEKFLVLGDLGMPVYWDIPPFYDPSLIAEDLTTGGNDEYCVRFLSYEDYLRDKEELRCTFRFYTLVEEE